MPSPFPGMDPYLEAPARWRGVHVSLIATLRGTLNRQLPPDYALVGRVTSGLDAVDRIATEPTDQANPDPSLREQPLRPVVIRRVTIREGR